MGREFRLMGIDFLTYNMAVYNCFDIIYAIALPPERNEGYRVFSLLGSPFKFEMTIFIKGQEIDLTDRKVQFKTFGKQFKVNASAEAYIKMCDERIQDYEMYISNLKELKQAKLTEKAASHKDELKALLASMGSEERAAFINNLNQ